MEIIIPSNKHNFVTDATLLSNIMKCSRYTDFKHNLNLQPIGGKGNSLEVGSIIHKFCEVYYKSQSQGLSKSQAFGFGISAAELYVAGCPLCTNFKPYKCDNCIDGVVNIQDDLTNAFIKCKKCDGKVLIEKPKCGHQIDEYPGLTNTPPESEGYVVGWKHALQTCDEYAKFYSNDFWITVDVEVVKSKILYEDDEIRILFKSKLDWIVDTNQGIFPCDHKTMKQNRDQITLNNQFMGQCLIMSTKNVFINKIGLQKSLKPEDKFKRVNISYTSDRLLEWQSYILPYWCKQAIAWDEQGHYAPNFSNCESKFGKCEFYDVCSANPNMREDELRRLFVVGNEWNPTNEE